MLVPDTVSHLEAQVHYHFSAIVGHDADGYWARCPELQGCYTHGRTYEEALANLREAVGLHVEDRLASGEEIPQVEAISLIAVERHPGEIIHPKVLAAIMDDAGLTEDDFGG